MDPLNEQKKQFQDEEYRYAYAESFLNSCIATQIVVLREQRDKMTQEELAAAIGTKQAGISRFENINYSSWNIKTLKKLARAFGCRLRVSFETFGSLIQEDQAFNEESLKRPRFQDDPVFQEAAITNDNLPIKPSKDLNLEFLRGVQTAHEFQEGLTPLRNKLSGSPHLRIFDVATHPLAPKQTSSKLLETATGG
jgi:transcriptional regulator with XRE-family HTH domain